MTLKQKLPVSRGDMYESALAALSADDLSRLKRGLHARGREVLDPFGIRIGTAVALMADRQTGRPQWLAIGLGNAVTGLPIKGVQLVGQHAHAMFASGLVLTAPKFDPDYLPASVERALCRHYACKPTLGALLDADEQRATSSRTFWTSEVGQGIGWLPGPRSTR
jgi:hypothetical protein